MKTLSDYTRDHISEALENNGAFFAFSNDQLNEKKKTGVKYANMGAGLVCPIDNCRSLKTALDNAISNGIKQDIKENGMDAIIKRELVNYECYYTGDIEDAVVTLSAYGITSEQIASVYKQTLDKNNEW